MIEITYEYWNKLANQVLMISSLLGGFSIAVVANILVADKYNGLTQKVMKAATLAAGSFLVTVFAMTKLIMLTTEGYPLKVTETDFTVARSVGFIGFLVGIISLIVMMSLAGWVKSKSMGRFATVVGFITLILILYMLS